MVLPDYNTEFTFTLVPTPEAQEILDRHFGMMNQGDIRDMSINERKAPTVAASSIWTEVTDLTTLKEGDRIKVTHDTTLLEITLGAPVEGPDEEGDYLINLAGLTCSDVFVPAEGSKFFIKEPEFAPLTRALEPGEVVEDRNGMRYILNPLNSNLVVHSAQGEDVLGFAYTEVRPVR